MLQFGGFSAKTVADFRAVGRDKFMILTKSGNMSFFEFSDKHIKKILDLDLNYASSDDLEFVTFCVCPKDKYLVVSVADKIHSQKRNLFLIEIVDEGKLNLLDRKNFEDEATNSAFSKLAIHYTSDNIPVVVCFEKGAGFNMVAFAVDDDQLNQVDLVKGYHSSPFLGIDSFNGEVNTIDIEGNLYNLPLVEQNLRGVRTPVVIRKGRGGQLEGSKDKEMRDAVANFERSNTSEEMNDGEVDMVLDREKEQLANNYNNRRSMTIDYNSRK